MPHGDTSRHWRQPPWQQRAASTVATWGLALPLPRLTPTALRAPASPAAPARPRETQPARGEPAPLQAGAAGRSSRPAERAGSSAGSIHRLLRAAGGAVGQGRAGPGRALRGGEEPAAAELSRSPHAPTQRGPGRGGGSGTLDRAAATLRARPAAAPEIPDKQVRAGGLRSPRLPLPRRRGCGRAWGRGERERGRWVPESGAERAPFAKLGGLSGTYWAARFAAARVSRRDGRFARERAPSALRLRKVSGRAGSLQRSAGPPRRVRRYHGPQGAHGWRQGGSWLRSQCPRPR